MTKTFRISVATTAFVVAVGLLAYVGIRVADAAASLFGGALFGVGHVILVSDTVTPFSGISFDDADGKVFSNLSDLQADFNVTDDNCGAGSPRFQIAIDTNNDTVSNGNIFVYLGPSPGFASCTPNTWTDSGNLIGNDDAGRWDFTQLGGPLGGYSNAPANVLNGKIVGISVVIDSGWNATASGGDGEQTVLIDNVSIVLSASYDFEPPTLIVDDNLVECPTAAYTTIQSAVNDANPGDIVQVCAGTYAENVTLAEDITLNGAQVGVDARGRVASEAIIAPTTVGITLQTGSAGATIDGFTISGGTQGIVSDSGPLNGLNILNNRIIGFTSGGIFLNDNGTDITVDQNVIDGSSKTGGGGLVHMDTDAMDGFWFTNNNVVNGNVVGTGTGLFSDSNRNVGVSASRSPKMTGNLFQDNTTGVNLGSRSWEFADISDNQFRDNTFDGLQGGMATTTITNNLFDGNGRSGIALTSFGNTTTGRGTFASTISFNTFLSNGFGTGTGEGIFLSSTQPVGSIGTNLINRNSIDTNNFGLRYGSTEAINAECNWWGDASGPGPVGPGSGDNVGASATIDFTSWLTTSDLVSGPCDGPLPPAPDVTVTIVKYVDGVHATAGNASSLSFPMDATWANAGFPDGGGSFALSTVGFNNPNEYEATTSDMDSGADYSAAENLTGPNVGASCSGGEPFVLSGYSIGDTLVDAEGAATSSNAVLTGITSDKFIIVWNETCAPAPTTGTIIVQKVLVNDDGGALTDEEDFSFSVNGDPSVAFEADGSNEFTLSPGTYSVVESAASGYTTTYTNSENANLNCNSLTLAAGETITCTITNDDNAAPAGPPPSNACDLGSVPGYTLQSGTAGSDNVTIAPFTMFVGLGGNDVVKGPAEGSYIVCLGAGSDLVTLGMGASTINAGDGNNSITTGSGDDYVISGSGSDKIVTGSGNDTIEAGDGNNSVKSGAGEDNITAGTGNDKIDGGADFDTCDAGSGFNSVTGCEA